MLRCLIILFVIGPLLISGVRAGGSPDGGAPTLRIARVIEVTDGSRIYTQPVWSPDGTKLAFSTLPGFGGVYIRNADGSGPIKELTSADYSGFKPVWTSDSKGIVIRTRTGVVGQSISYIDIETGEVKARERALHPRHPEMNVYGDIVIDVDGETRILDDSTASLEDKDEYYSDDRPASRDLRFERSKSDSKAWVIVEGDGTKVMDFPYRAGLASMSPTRDRIAFYGRDSNLYVSHLDGSGKISLGAGSAVWDWSPDGRWIVFAGAKVEKEGALTAAELFVANTNTGNLLQLTDTPDVVEMLPRWSPDGTRIAYSTSMAGKICVAFLESTK